jgi:hypothetical protein
LADSQKKKKIPTSFFTLTKKKLTTNK